MPWSYARGKRYWRQFHQRDYLFNDQFLTGAGPPLPNNTPCNPGPGAWRVIDTNSTISIAADQLTFGGVAPAAWDAEVVTGNIPFSRRSGNYLEISLTTQVANGEMKVGFFTGASALQANAEMALYFSPAGTVHVIDGGADVDTGYPYANATTYTVRIYDTGDGLLGYIAPGYSPTSGWSLLWERPSSTSRLVTIYPGLNVRTQALFQTVRVRPGMVRPPAVFLSQPGANEAFSCGASDFLLSANVLATTGTRALYFRVTDANNWFRMLIDFTNSLIKIQKCVATVVTTLASSSQDYTFANQRTYFRASVLAIGTRLRAYYGANLGCAATDSFNQTATVVGTGPYSGGTTVNDGDILNLQAQVAGTMLLNRQLGGA